MPKERILVVDDEDDILELVSYNLKKEGYTVAIAATGEAALREVTDQPPDLVVLDLMLPNVDGLEVCRRIKHGPGTAHIPVLMLTAKTEEADIVTGLEVGADDYITKPFSPRVFTARVRAALRRKQNWLAQGGETIRIHSLVIDPGRHEVRVEDRPVELTYTEFRIVQFLASRPGWAFSRLQIIEAVRRDNYAITDRSVDVHIVGLRRKLGSAGKDVETVRGVGYRFRE